MNIQLGQVNLLIKDIINNICLLKVEKAKAFVSNRLLEMYRKGCSFARVVVANTIGMTSSNILMGYALRSIFVN